MNSAYKAAVASLTAAATVVHDYDYFKRRIPADAQAVARMNLSDLSEAIGNTLLAGNVGNGYTKAHLLDCQSRIDTAMESGYELEVPKGR